jgi:hypothetical protein
LDTDLVLVIAHRGIWENCPEGTIESYNKALDNEIEAVEMDIRVTSPGTDSSGTNWPNGQAFLTHDYDLRGEAPDPSGGSNNVIYNLTPAQVSGRNMVDRHGIPAVDSSQSPIHFRSLKDLLTNIALHVRLINGGVDSNGSGNFGQQRVLRGNLLAFDIKGDDAKDLSGNPYPNSSQLIAVTETMAEVSDFEKANNIDLEPMIIYKIGYLKVSYSQWMNLVTTYYSNAADLPGLIPVEYPNSDKSKLDSARVFEKYEGFIMHNWNYRYDGVSTESYVNADLAAGMGNSAFSQNNNFPEGLRKSRGTCCTTTEFQDTSTSTLDFLAQPAYSSLPRVRATLITTDFVNNAVDYLSTLGLRHLEHIE